MAQKSIESQAQRLLNINQFGCLVSQNFAPPRDAGHSDLPDL